MDRNFGKTRFVSFAGTSSTNRGQVKEKFVLNPGLVYARARAPMTCLKFTTQAVLVTESIGNDVVTNNNRFAEL
jgi:hypothetical protein